MGPECGLKFPYKKEAEDDLTQKSGVGTEASGCLSCLKMEEETMSPGMLEKSRKEIFP